MAISLPFFLAVYMAPYCAVAGGHLFSRLRNSCSLWFLCWLYFFFWSIWARRRLECQSPRVLLLLLLPHATPPRSYVHFARGAHISRAFHGPLKEREAKEQQGKERPELFARGIAWFDEEPQPLRVEPPIHSLECYSFSFFLPSLLFASAARLPLFLVGNQALGQPRRTECTLFNTKGGPVNPVGISLARRTRV